MRGVELKEMDIYEEQSLRLNYITQNCQVSYYCIHKASLSVEWKSFEGQLRFMKAIASKTNSEYATVGSSELILIGGSTQL